MQSLEAPLIPMYPKGVCIAFLRSTVISHGRTCNGSYRSRWFSSAGLYDWWLIAIHCPSVSLEACRTRITKTFKALSHRKQCVRQLEISCFWRPIKPYAPPVDSPLPCQDKRHVIVHHDRQKARSSIGRFCGSLSEPFLRCSSVWHVAPHLQAKVYWGCHMVL